jgi:polar amino acid transport system substrate-binding protein
MKWILAILAVVAVGFAGWKMTGAPKDAPVGDAAGSIRTIRFGTEGAYPPFNYIDASGELKGFDIEIGKALCEKAGIQCSFVAQDWDGLIPGLQASKYDAIIASMSITPEREQAVSFTDRYYRTPIRFVAVKGRPLDISEEGLRGKKIGVQRGTTSAIFLEEHYKGIVEMKAYDTQENVYLDLLAGRLDGMLADAILAYDWINSEAGKNYEFRGETYFVDNGIGIAVRKGEEPLKKTLNTALEGILKDGTYETINRKYFPFSIY